MSLARCGAAFRSIDVARDRAGAWRHHHVPGAFDANPQFVANADCCEIFLDYDEEQRDESEEHELFLDLRHAVQKPHELFSRKVFFEAMEEGFQDLRYEREDADEDCHATEVLHRK